MPFNDEIMRVEYAGQTSTLTNFKAFLLRGSNFDVISFKHPEKILEADERERRCERRCEQSC